MEKNKKKNPTDTLSSSTSSPSPPWIELPREVTVNILHRLGAIEILETAQLVWRVIDLKNDGDYDKKKPNHYYQMFRNAVRRSQGQAIDINIVYFGTDVLLRLISQGSSHLRRLRLSRCDRISRALCKAVEKFPLLEELHLFCIPVTCEQIATIGHSCPLLKSFTFNMCGYDTGGVENDEYALAVAKSMPGLTQLGLIGNEMTNNGLEAILDGCPFLESLDLRQCFNVGLGGDLGKRCFKQMKELRRPLDPTDDNEWEPEIYDDEDDYGDYCNCFSSGTDSDSPVRASASGQRNWYTDDYDID